MIQLHFNWQSDILRSVGNDAVFVRIDLLTSVSYCRDNVVFLCFVVFSFVGGCCVTLNDVISRWTQMVPEVSSLNPLTTVFPLGAVLLVSAIKDAHDDIVSVRVLASVYWAGGFTR